MNTNRPICLLIAILTACQSAPVAELPRNEAVSQPLPPLRGPKPSIAVAGFDAMGTWTAEYGGQEVGGGLSAMLASELSRSGRFRVIERAHIDKIRAEHDLSGSYGKLKGAQLFIFGSVTHFGPESSGGGLRIGYGFGGNSDSSVNLNQKWSSGKVTMDLRVVDTTSGEILHTFTVSERVQRTNLGVGYSYRGMEVGSDKFEKTPLGDAARHAPSRDQ
jgi:curli biogenesis system outer membrane secretion channel CsgG